MQYSLRIIFNSVQFIYFPSLKNSKTFKKYEYVHNKMEEAQLKEIKQEI